MRLSGGDYAQLNLSCSSPGQCVAAATGGSGQSEALVATQQNSDWGSARPAPGLSGLSGGSESAISALSCSAAGWCALAGVNWPRGGSRWGKGVRPFVATAHDGVWSMAQPVPGLFALNRGWTTYLSAISCDPSGTCTAGGSYRAPSSDRVRPFVVRPFVVTETNGRWGSVQPIKGGSVIGTAAYNADSSMRYISCTSPGNCTAAGSGGNSTGTFVVTEQDGTWGQPEPLPGISPGTSTTTAEITGLFCSAPGRCVVVGFYGSTGDACGGEYNFCYEGNYSGTIPFIANQANGTWQAAREVPGVKALNRAGIAVISSLSCSSLGGCAAGGFTTGVGNGYATGVDNVPLKAFVVSEKGGTWSQAVRVPGLTGLASAGSEIDLISCGASAPARGCVAVGDYQTHTGSSWRGHMFVTTRP
jgi:hypothetical protein